MNYEFCWMTAKSLPASEKSKPYDITAQLQETKVIMEMLRRYLLTETTFLGTSLCIVPVTEK